MAKVAFSHVLTLSCCYPRFKSFASDSSATLSKITSRDGWPFY